VNVHGTDLVWWREGGGWHTLITLFGANCDELPAPLTLTFVLFGAGGGERARWTAPFGPEAVIVVDSARLGDGLPGALGAGDGVLAISASSPGDGGAEAPRPHRRLGSLVDWYTDDGRLASLHNDQSVVAGPAEAPQRLTEIVVRETAGQRNSLVVVNGPEPQRPGALALTLTNDAGARREAVYSPGMAPHSAHVIALGALVPDLGGFAGGGHLFVEGRFDSRGLFTRPYVLTEGERFGAYHGGDHYAWPALPAFAYKLLGDGEINPMAAIHRPGLTTIVNVLHSHGDVEDDFWIDARLWDGAGRLVAERRRWLLARRRGLSRGALQDLLPDAREPFFGHVALTYSACEAAAYPRRLQALLEYESPGAVSRVMAWSDHWNSGVKHGRMRRARRGLAGPADAGGGGEPSLRSYYRVWARPGFTTHLSLSNTGHPGYATSAPYVVRLRNLRGEELTTSGRLAPQATDLRAVNELFPAAAAFLAPGGIGLAVVESPCDLAIVQLTQSAAAGSWAVEHLMVMRTRVNGQVFLPAGA
jgi:hypothetical protein